MNNQSDALLELLLEQCKINSSQQLQLNTLQVQITELQRQIEFLQNGYYSNENVANGPMPKNVIRMR